MPSGIGHQFHFDADGTVVKVLNTSRTVTATLTGPQMQNCSVWRPTGVYGMDTTSVYMVFVFPQPRNLTHYSMTFTASGGTGPTLSVSYDTTDGLNGNWTQVRAPAETNKWFNGGPHTLRAIEPFGYNSVTGVQYYFSMTGHNITGFNLFGTYSRSGLGFWHPTLDEELPGNWFDYGDILRGDVINKDFRVKNFNALTANNVLVATAAPANGSSQGNIYFSDGGAFTATVNIASIASGAISSVITARYTVPSNAQQTNLENTRITATAGSWT